MEIIINNPITSGGDKYKTFSITNNTIVDDGLVSFVVESDLSYIKNQDIIILNTDSSDYMNGYINSYNPINGLLQVRISNAVGLGNTYNKWIIGLDAIDMQDKLYKFTVEKPSDLSTITEAKEGDIARAFKPNKIMGIVTSKEGAYTFTDGSWVYSNRSLQSEILQNDLDIDLINNKVDLLENSVGISTDENNFIGIGGDGKIFYNDYTNFIEYTGGNNNISGQVSQPTKILPFYTTKENGEHLVTLWTDGLLGYSFFRIGTTPNGSDVFNISSSDIENMASEAETKKSHKISLVRNIKYYITVVARNESKTDESWVTISTPSNISDVNNILKNSNLFLEKQNKTINNGNTTYNIEDYLNSLSSRNFVIDFQNGLI